MFPELTIWLYVGNNLTAHIRHQNPRKCPNFLLCQGIESPDITGGGLNSEATYTNDGVYKGSGCVKATNDGGSNPNRNLPAGSQYAWCWWGIDASWSNIKYGASATVQPIAFQTLMIVKI